MSPWSEPPLRGDRRPGADQVAAIIKSLDPRGAWTEEGVIGKADRMVTVRAARPRVLTINNRAHQINENDRITLFQGAQPPRERIIRSATFVRNLELLAACVAHN